MRARPVLVVRRHIAVPRERVFEASLDSENLAPWMRPLDVTHVTVTIDPRVGGGFQIVMEPPSLLSFTWISRHTDHKPDSRHHRVS